MKILIVAATEGEIERLRNINSVHEINYIVTGVGMVSTTYELTRVFGNNNYDLAINCGLAGSFDRTIELGEVVRVTDDILAELGAEDGEDFLNLTQLNLPSEYYFQETFTEERKALKKVSGITVNTVHGNEKNIEHVLSRHTVQTESMEGAAFFYVCKKEGIMSIQIRAISNYIERRNRNSWKIEMALNNLSLVTEEFIHSLK